jgi:AAA15 family ATPase/GTPase
MSRTTPVFIFLIEIKCDLEEKKNIRIEEAEKWEFSHDLSYFETSAQPGFAANLLFTTISVRLETRHGWHRTLRKACPND